MFKILNEKCTPTRGTKFSACIDLYASEDFVIGSGKTKVIGLGVCIDLEQIKCLPQFNIEILEFDKRDDEFDDFLSSHYIQLMLRSSLGVQGLILPNGVGVIDLDYKDEIKMIIHNTNKEDYDIKVGDKIAQATILKHLGYYFGIETDVVRDGGLGSTGA